jgi:hypothetical protein
MWKRLSLKDIIIIASTPHSPHCVFLAVSPCMEPKYSLRLQGSASNEAMEREQVRFRGMPNSIDRTEARATTYGASSFPSRYPAYIPVLIKFALSCGLWTRFAHVVWVCRPCREVTIMEKICTRCQFRNPASRRGCQVCGYAKFQEVSSVALAIAKQPDCFSMFLDQTIAAASAAIEKIAELQHKLAAPQHIESGVSLKPLPTSTNGVDEASTVFESNDLDSMMAWFKSYGVDKPLILQRRTSQSDRSKAA